MNVNSFIRLLEVGGEEADRVSQKKGPDCLLKRNYDVVLTVSFTAYVAELSGRLGGFLLRSTISHCFNTQSNSEIDRARSTIKCKIET